MATTAIPTTTTAELVAAPPAAPFPGSANQRWAGAPTALVDGDSIVLAYRTRGGDGDAVVLARSPLSDGVRFETVTTLTAAALGVPMTERAAPVRTAQGWRLYVSCADDGSAAWWVGVLEAPTLTGLADATVRRLAIGDPALDALKDPIVHATADGWGMWLCRHPLDVPGAEDRMTTVFATSADGTTWDVRGTVLRGRPGCWDARGARVTSILPDGRAWYDGRATAAENWFERAAIAAPAIAASAADRAAGPIAATAAGGAAVGGAVVPELRADGAEPLADVRYVEALALPDGSTRLYYEARRADGSHELRTERRP